MALVQAQAVSCNLPIIGSLDSGASDIKQYVDNPEYINIVDPLTVDNIVNALFVAIEQSKKLEKIESYAGNGLINLTWEAYGRRYSEFLKTHRLSKKGI